MGIGVVLALMAAVGYGTADFVGGLTARRASPWAFAGQLAGGLVMLAAGLCLPGQARPADFAWALMAGPGFGLLFVALAQGAAGGRASARPAGLRHVGGAGRDGLTGPRSRKADAHTDCSDREPRTEGASC